MSNEVTIVNHFHPHRKIDFIKKKSYKNYKTNMNK